MNEQEQKDLDVMKAQVEKEKLSTYHYLVHLSRMDARGLETSGYRGKTVAEAVLMALKSGEQKIKRLIDSHISKYPD